MPIIPSAIDSSTRRDATKSVTAAKAMKPKRSGRGARLRNAHHTATAKPPASPPPTEMNPVAGPGTASGTTPQHSHCTEMAATPGHNRSSFFPLGFPSCSWLVCIRPAEGPSAPARRSKADAQHRSSSAAF